jgi:AcrR family transcriptional regulator
MVHGATGRELTWVNGSVVGRLTKMDVRARILDAALGLLARGGAGELTQPRVARAAGVRQSHLTYYFPTRDALLQAVADRSIDALAATLMRAAQGGRLGPQALPRALARAITDKGRTRTMLALIGTADRDPAVRKRLRRFITEARSGSAVCWVRQADRASRTTSRSSTRCWSVARCCTSRATMPRLAAKPRPYFAAAPQ